MKWIVVRIVSIVVALISSGLSIANASGVCVSDQLLAHPENVLQCYIQLPESPAASWQLIKKVDTGGVVIETWRLHSQNWPKNTLLPGHTDAWWHELIVYLPKQVTQQTALLAVGDGTRYPLKGNPAMASQESIAIANAARQTQSVIAIVYDIPNQYLYFEDGIPRKEDSLIAYSWARFLNNPANNTYWLAHLPMTKAVVRAMDAVSQIATRQGVTIKSYVLTGASKRGLTTWLTALVDDRVTAIIPIVIDILNMEENIDYVHEAFGEWPGVWKDYVENGIINWRFTPEFHLLTAINDPLRYLVCDGCERFVKRLSIPKYIISASGDDFFSTASLSLFFDKLPGEKYAMVVPNTGHELNHALAFDAVSAYYKHILYHTVLPALDWKRENGLLKQVMTNRQPTSVTLWEAQSRTKDFRYGRGVRYSSYALNGSCVKDTCVYPVPSMAKDHRWHARFVEVRYGLPDHIVLTTPAWITDSDGKE